LSGIAAFVVNCWRWKKSVLAGKIYSKFAPEQMEGSACLALKK